MNKTFIHVLNQRIKAKTFAMKAQSKRRERNKKRYRKSVKKFVKEMQTTSKCTQKKAYKGNNKISPNNDNDKAKVEIQTKLCV